MNLALVRHRHRRRREAVQPVSEPTDHGALVTALPQEGVPREISAEAVDPGRARRPLGRTWERVAVGMKYWVHKTSLGAQRSVLYLVAIRVPLLGRLALRLRIQKFSVNGQRKNCVMPNRSRSRCAMDGKAGVSLAVYRALGIRALRLDDCR